MDEPLRHRRTKGAATCVLDLTPPRDIPTLTFAIRARCPHVRFTAPTNRHRGTRASRPERATNGLPNLAAVGENARGRNAAFPSMRPVLADQYRSPQGCLPTIRVQLRGYSSAPGFRARPRQYGSRGCRHALPASARGAAFLRARRTDGLFKDLTTIVWMHGGVAVAVENNNRDRPPAA
jgi:hypothetical protein